LCERSGARGAAWAGAFLEHLSEPVQADFQQAVLLLHSFEFPQAEELFRKVESGDPRCSIAAWGLALAETERQGADAPAKTLAKGWSELKPWLARPAGSEREGMYLSAVRGMYEDYEHTAAAVRGTRYLNTMSAIRTRYPGDVNAGLFYALGLEVAAGSGPEGIAQRRRALAILLPIFKAHPRNPGAAHYIIHSADTPELARIALPAAREYAAIAPDAPHALHMPSHIFNRLGKWRESIAANLASARVAREWMDAGRGGLGDEQHALNNLEYAYLQLGDTARARSIIDQIDTVAHGPGGDPWFSIDARIYLDAETHAWQDAVGIKPPPASPAEENFDVDWIHAIPQARLGNAAAARSALEAFRASSDKWAASHGFADVLHLALLEAEAWTLYAELKPEEAVREFSQAAAFEKAHPVYYADVLPRPASEMRGEMLLEMGCKDEACTAFRAALRIPPNTYESVAGLRLCSLTRSVLSSASLATGTRPR
jgi:tetratricopeptide (TPR) repeat protein